MNLKKFLFLPFFLISSSVIASQAAIETVNLSPTTTTSTTEDGACNTDTYSELDSSSLNLRLLYVPYDGINYHTDFRYLGPINNVLSWQLSTASLASTLDSDCSTTVSLNDNSLKLSDLRVPASELTYSANLTLDVSASGIFLRLVDYQQTPGAQADTAVKLFSVSHLAVNSYAESCSTDVTSYSTAISNLVLLANVEQEVYADILLTFSESGSKPLFDSSVSLGENDQALLTQNYENILLRTGDLYNELKPCYDATMIFLEQGTSKKRSSHRGLISSVKNFFYGFMGGTIENSRNIMLNIGQNDTSTKQEMFDKAKYLWPDKDFGSDASVFYDSLKSGGHSTEINHLHNSLMNDPDTNYWLQGDQVKGRPIDRVIDEGKKGLEAGSDLLIDSTKTIIGGSIPGGDGFGKGYDYAKDAVDAVNEAEKNGGASGVWKFIESTGLRELEDKAKSFFSSKSGLGNITTDGIADYSKNIAKSVYGYLNNLWNHNASDEELNTKIDTIKTSNDADDSNNKVITINVEGEQIDSPTIGVVIANNIENDQPNEIIVVIYPDNNNKEVLVNIDDEAHDKVEVTFINADGDQMIEKDIPISSDPVMTVEKFTNVVADSGTSSSTTTTASKWANWPEPQWCQDYEYAKSNYTQEAADGEWSFRYYISSNNYVFCNYFPWSSYLLESEIPIVDDKWHGIAKFYYDEGAISSYSEYSSGRQDGYYVGYSETGEVSKCYTASFKDNAWTFLDCFTGEDYVW